MNYYNENNKWCADQLRRLIAEGEIDDGFVDDRDVREVDAADLAGYDQVHLFAGIGGFALALRYAGLNGLPGVWTGSCPCQPFSLAGKRRGFDDERHLWGEMFRLIRECRPSVVFGEQVTPAIGNGWLDLVFDDLEACDYACGASDLPACCVGSPQIRQRLWWFANSNMRRSDVASPANCGGGEGGARQAGEAFTRPLPRRALPELWSVGVRQSGIPCAVDGVSAELAHVTSGYGNSIIPALGAVFIQECMACCKTPSESTKTA